MLSMRIVSKRHVLAEPASAGVASFVVAERALVSHDNRRSVFNWEAISGGAPEDMLLRTQLGRDSCAATGSKPAARLATGLPVGAYGAVSRYRWGGSGPDGWP
jgi:hypothetical protein